MAKYHITTDKGEYDIETEEPSAGKPQSYLGKLASNIPSSAAKTSSSALAAFSGGGGLNQPDTLAPPPAGEDPDKPFYLMRQAGRSIADVANKIRHPFQTLQEDPVGTIASVGQLASAGRGGIGRFTAPSVEDAMSSVPQGFNLVHPDVRQGAAKATAGAALTELAPGPFKWPARSIAMYPGARQAYRGLTNPDAYAEQALKDIPKIEAPVNPAPSAAPKMPKVFGDPEGFSKLPPQVQEAYMRGESTAPAASKPTPMEPRGPEHYGIASPAAAAPTPGTIPVPKPTVEGAVTKLDMPAHEPYESYSPSRVERQLTPAVGNPAQDAQVERLRKAFPWETDQQLRARAGHAGVMGKLASKPGAMENMKKLKQSLGGE